MTRHDPLIRIRHMLDHAQEAVELLGSKTLEQLQADRLLQLGLTRLIEIIGEAASQVPKAYQNQHSHVPWHETRRMRNQLIHGYDVIRYDLVWATVTNDLPPLIEQLKSILPDESYSNPDSNDE